MAEKLLFDCTVSIIMPSFNNMAHVQASLLSVMAQSFQNWELVVSDDGSADSTLGVINRFQERDVRIRLLTSDVNQGPARARNAAIKAATGRYIAFLDSDDLWKPQKLERQIAFMHEQDIAFSFTSYDRINESGKFLNTHHVDSPVTYYDLLKNNVIGCLTAVYDTEKLGKVYMPERWGAEDFGLWLRILKMVDAAYPVPESLAQYRVRAGSVSANKLSAAKYTWSVYRDVEKLGLARSAYYFAHYAAHGILNTYVLPRLNRVIKT